MFLDKQENYGFTSLKQENCEKEYLPMFLNILASPSPFKMKQLGVNHHSCIFQN